jgi:hypothetical protein
LTRYNNVSEPSPVAAAGGQSQRKRNIFIITAVCAGVGIVILVRVLAGVLTSIIHIIYPDLSLMNRDMQDTANLCSIYILRK